MPSSFTGKPGEKPTKTQLIIICIVMMVVSTLMGLGVIYPLRPATLTGWLALIFFCPGLYLALGFVFEKYLWPKLDSWGKKLSPKAVSPTRIVVLLGLMLSWVALLVIVYNQVKPFLSPHFLEW
jgi:hypothetical protein